MAVATKQLKKREKIIKDNIRNSYLKRIIRLPSHSIIVSEDKLFIFEKNSRANTNENLRCNQYF